MTHIAFKHSVTELRNGLLYEVNNGTVNRQIDDETGLELYSYSKTCPFKKENWNDFTRVARGIILDPKKETIVNLPFEKFFNYGEESISLPDTNYSVYEKLDGSLVCLWNFNDKWYTSTKGSFTSEQAKWGYDYIVRNKDINIEKLNKSYCYCFEAIYKENKIVIPYNEEGMFLLAVFDREKGEEIFCIEKVAKDVGFKVVKKKNYSSISELLKKTETLPTTEEGWVLRFNNSYRVKIKGKAYLKLHRAIMNITPIFIWGLMKDGEDLLKYKKEIPEEFWNDFDRIVYLLNLNVFNLINLIKTECKKWEGFSDKDIGLSINLVNKKVRPYIFSYRKNGGLLDKKIMVKLFNDIRPTSNYLSGYTQKSSISRIEDDEQ